MISPKGLYKRPFSDFLPKATKIVLAGKINPKRSFIFSFDHFLKKESSVG